MDVPLYAIGLGVFGTLYLVLGVFLVFALFLTLLAMYLYLTLRYGRLPDDYPYGPADTLITAIFIGVTWGIFTLLAPKNPIPLVGEGLTYTTAAVPYGAILAIAVVLLIGFLVVGAVIVPRLSGGSGGRDTSGGDQTVGAG